MFFFSQRKSPPFSSSSSSSIAIFYCGLVINICLHFYCIKIRRRWSNSWKKREKSASRWRNKQRHWRRAKCSKIEGVAKNIENHQNPLLLSDKINHHLQESAGFSATYLCSLMLRQNFPYSDTGCPFEIARIRVMTMESV